MKAEGTYSAFSLKEKTEYNPDSMLFHSGAHIKKIRPIP